MGFLNNIEKDLKNLTKWLTGDKPVSKKKAAVKSKPAVSRILEGPKIGSTT